MFFLIIHFKNYYDRFKTLIFLIILFRLKILNMDSNCTFYLSNGFLTEIINRKSLFQASAIANNASNLNGDSKVILRFSLKPFLLQVVDVCFYNSEKIFSLELFDGNDKLEVVLDKSYWPKLNSKFLFNANIDNLNSIDQNYNAREKLDIGSVIILHEYTFSDITTSNVNGPILDVVTILNLVIIGHQTVDIQIQNKKALFNLDLIRMQIKKPEQSAKIKPANIDACHLIPTHSISFLSLKLSHQKWQIKAQVSKMTKVKEFKNQFSGKDGKVIRLQIIDHSGSIEAVAFNDEIEKVESLIINETYFISNADIKKSKSNYNAWNDEKESIQNAYELAISKDTLFIHCSKPNPIESSEINLENFKKETTISQEQTPNENSPKLKRCEKYKHLIPLNEISLQKEGTITNVIGIINKINDIKIIKPKNKDSIKLRNFFLIDQTQKDIKCALWGTEAEQFSFPIGTILMLNKVKMSNYDGVSLSIQRETNMLEILSEWTHIDIANELREWWQNTQADNLAYKLENETSKDERNSMKREISISSLVENTKAAKH